MQTHTQPPYRLTLKSNGCLILIAALSPTQLVVTSKHSLGTTTEAERVEMPETVDSLIVDGLEGVSLNNAPLTRKGPRGNGKTAMNGHAEKGEEEDEEKKEAQAHAEVGRRWLRNTLQATEKTEAGLARKLWEGNLTAVLEVCSIPRVMTDAQTFSALRRFV